MIQIKVVLASLGPCVPSASEVSVSCKGTPHLKKNVFFRALPKLPLPLPFFWATCTSFSAVIKEYIKCIF